MKTIRDLDLTVMTGLMDELGEKPFRARQLFEWVHARGTASFDEMSNLSKALRRELSERFIIDPLRLLKKQESADGSTKKYLFELPDGETVESVWMRYRHGDSICVSSQVGCRMGCTFCASTLNGRVRDLTPGEIISQIYDIERDVYRDTDGSNSAGHISGVIIMGMGEPFDNYDNVIAFVRLLTDSKGRNMSARSITISTCGIPDGIIRLAEEGLPVTLALSLHAPNDGLRQAIMPIAKKYPLKDVLSACEYFFKKTGRRVTFEYSLMKGVNDSDAAAVELSELCMRLQKKGMPVHVNLIPLNEVAERKLTRSREEIILGFKRILENNRINVTVRREMGHEIDAACGQLRHKHTGDTFSG
ncbi:MAG: 23S rRNA (adenine(2503)-C(2))-methyltransferase RlmN [Eubacterium sp.]|nr:23S rRNA (adenine(2503)-C(2))-methyltransferase RlmN [Eubacterium sp.]